MHRSEPTPEEQVAASVASLKDTLRNRAESAPDGAKAHAEQLVEIGEAFLKLRQRPSPESYAPRPHKLSLSVSLTRIAQRLKVLAVCFVVSLVLVFAWNALLR